MKKMRKKTAFGTEFAFHSGRSAAFLLLALSFFLQVSTPDLRGADLPAIHIASDGKNAASASLGETSAEHVPSKSETPAPPASQASSGVVLRHPNPKPADRARPVRHRQFTSFR